MANIFEPITKYVPEAVDKYFIAESKTVMLENSKKYIDLSFKETGYVKIATFLLDGLANYIPTQEQVNVDGSYSAYAGNLANGSRDGFAIGNASVTWQIYQLQWKRGRQFRIDHISDEETAKIALGNMVEDFHKYHVIPEVDECRFSELVKATSVTMGNLVAESLSANAIIARFNSAFEYLSNHEVPSDRQVIFVSTEVMTLIRNTTELEKRLTQADFKNGDGVSFTLRAYEGRPIIEVPPSRFYTDVTVGNNGFMPTAGVSKAINFIICDLMTAVPIRKIEWSKMFDENVVKDWYGWAYDYLMYHGIVIPKNKVTGIYASVASSANASAKANVLDVDIREGSAQYSWMLNNFVTRPTGLKGQIVYSANALTLGATVTVGTGNTAINVGDVVTEANGSAVTYYFGLVDARGTVIATSGALTFTPKQ